MESGDGDGGDGDPTGHYRKSTEVGSEVMGGK